MAEGITIHDAALEIDADGLESLLQRRGTALTVRRLDATLSGAALTALLGGAKEAVEGERTATPTHEVAVTAGRLAYRGTRADAHLEVTLETTGLSLAFTGEGLRVTTPPEEAAGE